MKFYTFSQSNSGGSFTYDDDDGISEYVIIEAVDKKSAIEKAEYIGLYFDGCITGYDCDCCGDRWHSSPDEAEFPSVYGEEVSNKNLGSIWRKDGPSVYVHHADGRIEGFPDASALGSEQ